MEDTLPNEYSVLNNYRQIFCYHIQRLVGISPRGYDRVRSSVIDAFLPPVENLIKVPPVQSVCRLRQYGALSSHLRPLKSFKKVGSVEVTKKVLGLRPKIFPKKKKLLVSSKMFNLKRGNEENMKSYSMTCNNDFMVSNFKLAQLPSLRGKTKMRLYPFFRMTAMTIPLGKHIYFPN